MINLSKEAKRKILISFGSCFLLDTIGIFIGRDYNLLSYILFTFAMYAVDNKLIKKREKAC